MNTPSPEQHESPLKRLAPYLAVAWLVLFWCLFFTTPLPNASNSERTIDRLDVIGILPEIYESLFVGDPDRKASSSWSNLSERLDVLGAALLIVFSVIAAGRLILRGLGLLTALRAEDQLALAGGLGVSAVSLWTLGCGLAGLLSGPLFDVAMAAVILAEIWLSWSSDFRHRDRRSDAAVSANDGGQRWLGLIVVMTCVPFLGCMLLGSMLPPTDFDVKEYHLGGPKEYFLAGRIHFLPHDVYTSFPFLTEMLSLSGMVVRGDWERGAYVGQTVLMFFAPLTALGVYCAARRLGGPAAGWMGVLAYLTAPWTYRISIIAYTEGALCCYVVLSLLAFQIWKERASVTEVLAADESGAQNPWRLPFWRELLVLGCLAGSAVSTKYPGMILVAIPFAVAVAICSWMESKNRFQTAALSLLVYGGGVLIAFGPWMLKNLFETGNPVYPLLYGVFGGVDWNESLHRKWQSAHPARLWAGSWDDFAGVFYKNDWQSPLLFGLAPLAFLGKNKRTVGWVAAYAGVLLAGWYLLTHRIDRFWVPMNSVMAVLAGCGLANVLGLDRKNEVQLTANLQKGKGKAKQRAVAMNPSPLLVRIIALGLVIVATIYNFGFITTPLCGYNAYLTSYAAAQEETQTQSVKIVDWLKLPADSKVLFVGEAELFNAHFPYAYNTVFDHNLFELWTSIPMDDGTWTLKSTEEIREKFLQEKITHVFVNWNEILRYRTTYGFTDYATPARFQDLVQLGVLSPVPLPESIALRSWDRVDGSWKAEIERWAPELKIVSHGRPEMLQYQCFRVDTGEKAEEASSAVSTPPE
ncbi:ArnT family glycosyltransferase [Planctomicrobium sp. SH661]|uniref:ArnT family glycosyltransferase n=1 Tax=Planctomicrobium sp. SH661 TaxID=3448124 RepID=UPI003F5C753A